MQRQRTPCVRRALRVGKHTSFRVVLVANTQRKNSRRTLHSGMHTCQRVLVDALVEEVDIVPTLLERVTQRPLNAHLRQVDLRTVQAWQVSATRGACTGAAVLTASSFVAKATSGSSIQNSARWREVLEFCAQPACVVNTSCSSASRSITSTIPLLGMSDQRCKPWTAP